MKLRISGNSIRLRLLRSELTSFIDAARIEQTVRFDSGDAALIYGLEHEPNLAKVEVRYKHSEVVVVIPSHQAISWAETDQIGIYSSIDLGRHGTLDIVVEKDFACLDLSDADNHDTFPNPQMGAIC